MQITLAGGYLVIRNGQPVAWPQNEWEAVEVASNEARQHPGEVVSLEYPTAQFLQPSESSPFICSPDYLG